LAPALLNFTRLSLAWPKDVNKPATASGFALSAADNLVVSRLSVPSFWNEMPACARNCRLPEPEFGKLLVSASRSRDWMVRAAVSPSRTPDLPAPLLSNLVRSVMVELKSL
jgi:hypothetical protein